MDKIDKQILDILKNDSRFSAKSIASMIGQTEDVVAQRVADMEESGVLVKYTTVVNSELTGDDYVVALIEVKVNQLMDSTT